MKKTGREGFTVAELLVVTGIVVILSAIILAKQNMFGGRVQLQNFAYDLALSMRQAQAYGTAVQRFGASTFNAGYGLHFDMNSPMTYILFADTSSPSTGVYGDVSERLQTSTITRGYKITQICVTPSSGIETCTPGIPTSLDMVFVRPEPDALISNGSSCFGSDGKPTINCAQTARIVVSSPQGDTASVVVWRNGQISVQ